MAAPNEADCFQHFRVLRREDGGLWELGRGAMGVTYKAFDTQLGSHVALKVINPTILHDATARERFLREARAAAHLNHPNVASVFHLNADAETVFYAMQFVEGETLEALVKRRGPLPARRALRITLQAAQGLAAANERGLIHRDIKPANLMLVRSSNSGSANETGEDDEDDDDLLVKVIDFGLAKSLTKEDAAAALNVSLTGQGPIGTPYFMSPEQIDPASVAQIDARTDIYSLGVTLWYLLIGSPPFQGTQFQVFSQHISKPPPLERLSEAGLAPDLVTLVGRMLAKEPENRPANYRELIGALKRLLRGSAPPGIPPPAPTGFPLIAVLRQRGALPPREAFFLLGSLAALVDTQSASAVAFTAENLRIEFPVAPSNLSELPALPPETWPQFVVRLAQPPEETSAADAAGRTLALPSGRLGSTGRAGRVRQLGALAYELLGGTRPGARYVPLTGLSEEGNLMLRECLHGPENTLPPAAEFVSTLSRTAAKSGPHPLPNSPPGSAVVPPLPPPAAPAQTSASASVSRTPRAALLVGGLTLLVLLAAGAFAFKTVLTGSSADRKPETRPLPAPAAPTAAANLPFSPPLPDVAPPTPSPRPPPATSPSPSLPAVALSTSPAFDASPSPARVAVVAETPAPRAATSPEPRLGQRWVNSLGMRFVPVAGTRMLFSVWETRVVDFSAFVAATGYDTGNGMVTLASDGWKQRGANWRHPGFAQGPDHPVLGVNWNQANAFCEWLTRQERSAGRLPGEAFYRLPTDLEWSAAVGLPPENGATPKERSDRIKGVYPWGQQWPPPSHSAGNYRGEESRIGQEPAKWSTIPGYRDGFARTAPVGSFPANRFGIHDLGGNVWEWCADLFAPGRPERVLRGASWRNDAPTELLSSHREDGPPDSQDPIVGFRCVLDNPEWNRQP